MKKLFLFLMGIAFLVSCSDDSQAPNDASATTETTTHQTLKSGTADPVLKQLYVDMINSRSYIEFNTAVTVFNDKLGNQIPENEMTTSTKMLQWIANNLSSTNFQSHLEAINKWDDVETLSAVEYNANYSFHNYLGGTQPGTLITIIEEVEPTPSACVICQNQYRVCINIVFKAYASIIENAADELKAGTITEHSYNSTKSSALSIRRKAQSNCIRTLNQCCLDNQG